ncbi:signal peptide peptidase SppA [Elioraea sp. Yellowstone]|jgi:protease-4|uniref:signal peptide peptidase SppA n=1 Tax=Elioraea sp. Yellowstone TaxID=2592070 RepID=UPI001154E1E8|nr:signal peptide peptidase SppA [Elioraea sp. Yellowstone]TQF76923.1 signal peptide peptidase SppA [Elioraea sp. Yellowstone]
MSLETDLLIDRRRLKRGLALWRVVAILAVFAAAAVALRDSGPARTLLGAHVARLAVTGLITEDRERDQALRDLARDGRARALIVAIDSPGGTVAGGEALHRALAEVARAKPVVAVMGGTAASAGYMIALPAQRIFAREATVTGSIGVIMQTVEFSGLMERLGISAQAITGGSLKDEPSPFRPLSPEGRAALAAVVQDLHAQFIAMVAEGRGMAEPEVRALADGRVFTGRQALAAKLVDAIGGEAEARAWLAAEKGVPADLPLRDVTAAGERRWLSRLLRDARKAVSDERLSLDGLFAVWHPSLQ